MRFGMGEVFQFSSPYKWRCSKRFYRLFVYCSWLLIARDNSTGFTIQWGQGTTNTYTQLPRSFTWAFRAVGSANTAPNTDNCIFKELSNTHVKFDQYGHNIAHSYIAVGLS